MNSKNHFMTIITLTLIATNDQRLQILLDLNLQQNPQGEDITHQCIRIQRIAEAAVIVIVTGISIISLAANITIHLTQFLM